MSHSTFINCIRNFFIPFLEALGNTFKLHILDDLLSLHLLFPCQMVEPAFPGRRGSHVDHDL